jgi:hypothetical protein
VEEARVMRKRRHIKRFDYGMSGHWIKQAAAGDFSHDGLILKHKRHSGALVTVRSW